MIASSCLAESELALLLDGKAKRSERGRWLAHLDVCQDCRSILAEAASYLEEVAGDESRASFKAAFSRVLHRPALVWASAVLLVAIAIVSYGLLDPMRWFLNGEPVVALSSGAATMPLFGLSASSYGGNLWQSSQRGLGFSSTLGSEQRAFRVGVYLVDLRVAAQEGLESDASALLDELETLMGDGHVAVLRDSLVAGASADRLRRDFARVDSEAFDRLDRNSLSTGIWCEAARLAAAANESSYFGDAAFKDGLTAIRGLEHSAAVASSIETISGLASQQPGAFDLDRLQRELRELILLSS